MSQQAVSRTHVLGLVQIVAHDSQQLVCELAQEVGLRQVSLIVSYAMGMNNLCRDTNDSWT